MRLPELQAAIDWAFAEEERFATLLTSRERTAQGEPTRWSAKDVLAHVAEWKQIVSDFLWAFKKRAKKTSGESAPEPIDERNRRIYEKYCAMTLEQVMEHSQSCWRNLRETLVVLGEAFLMRPEHEHDPLWEAVFGNAVGHAVSHLAGYYEKHNQLERATSLRQRYDSRMKELGFQS